MAKNYYQVLGVGNYATKSEIELAYQNKIFKTETVNKAYVLLTHDVARRNYDKKLAEEEKEKSYYEILSVSPTATTREITLAYEKIKNKKDILEEELSKAKKAYETLKSPSKRTKYNIQQGFVVLEKKSSLKLTTDISNIINSKPDFYVEYTNEKRQYMIKRTKEQIKELKEEIDELKSEEELTEKQETRLKKLQEQIKQARKTQREYKSGLVVNYKRQIYIKKYENKIDLINQQIDMLKSEKKKDSSFYRTKLAILVDQLEMAQMELRSWQLGRGQSETVKEIVNGKEEEYEIKGKGAEETLVSRMLYNSIEKMNHIDSQLKKKDISNVDKIKLNIKRGFWKYVKAFSAGTIKLETSAMLKIQDIAYLSPNYFYALNTTEKEVEESLEQARRVK